MQSFRSKHYPSRRHKFFVTQEYAMVYYAVVSLMVMMGAIFRVNSGKEILWFSLIGESLALFLGNLLASAAMKRRIAEVLFVSESYSLINVYDLVNNEPAASFPLKFANPTRNGNEIQVHYQDMVITLKKEDFDDFELIWNWMIAVPQP